MIKILVKAAVLVCVVLSIFFIVNPSACSNLINGRTVNSTEELPTFVPSNRSHSELLTPQGDQQLEQPVGQPVQPEQPAPSTQPVQPVVQPLVSTSTQQTTQPAVTVPVVTDTNSALQNQQPATTAPAPSEKPYTQADIDYAIASRYVELENEYLAKKKDIKNAAKEISYIVMDDFELTPSEWEAFLQRATVDNLFEKVRQQQAK